MTTGHADHVGRNRTHWDRLTTEYAEWAPRAWAGDEATWGIWRLPERDLRSLPKVAGKDVVELACDAAYWSAWLARRGAGVVGLDNSWCQLETARPLRRTHGLDIPLVHADAERVPLRSASFDVALSEYGASIWCDPNAGSRRRRGCCARAVSWCSSATACSSPSAHPTARAKPTTGWCVTTSACIGWSGPATSRWSSRFRSASGSGSSEPPASTCSISSSCGRRRATRYPHVTSTWARRWPSQEIWRLRKRP